MAHAEGMGDLITCDYIGHRKVRVVLTDQEAASVLAFAFAGRPQPSDVDDMPEIVRRRAGKVAMRKLLMAQERTRVRFWNHVHVGHVELAGLDRTHRPQLRQQKVYVTFTLEQAHALYTYGSGGKLRTSRRGPAPSSSDSGVLEIVDSALSKIRHAIDGMVHRYRKSTGHREWFWGGCKNPLNWLSEKILRNQLELERAEASPR
jgi:hypothetical protein